MMFKIFILCICCNLLITNSYAQQDITWLNKITWGINSDTLQHYQKVGKEQFLAEQLEPQTKHLPPDIEKIIKQLTIEQHPSQTFISQLNDYSEKIKLVKNADDKFSLSRQIRKNREKLDNELSSKLALYSVYSKNQLQDQMTWFWLNHFSVFKGKRNVKWLLNDYVEHSIRPHALGSFEELLMANITSPAMLIYLDNIKNVRGKTNENYARELLELHTLGANGGYNQNDVQQLALILTGLGVNFKADKNTLTNNLQHLVVFDPKKHQTGDKILLNTTINSHDADELRKAIGIIIQHPSCATFISQKIATFFVSDEPPKALVDKMADTFRKTNGNIKAVLEVLFLSDEIIAHKKFKDPQRFIVSTLRLADQPKKTELGSHATRWLKMLGQPSFGRLTPDGYPLFSQYWTSSGQLISRFDIAQDIVKKHSHLSTGNTKSYFNTVFYTERITPYLSKPTQSVLEKARTPLERDTLLLSSPDMNYF